MVPEPVVAGVVSDAPPTELALNLPTVEIGGAPTLLGAHFVREQIGWKTFMFKAVPPLGADNAQFAWNFGDGTTSVQSEIKHTFPKPGVYTVTLGTANPDGTITTETQTIHISFFNLGNPLLLGTLLALTAILFGLLLLIIKIRRGDEV